jgi:hypothetical protein
MGPCHSRPEMAQPSEGKGIQTADRASGSPSRPAAAGDDTRVCPLSMGAGLCNLGTGAWVKACGFRLSCSPPPRRKRRPPRLIRRRPALTPALSRTGEGASPLVVGVARPSSADRRGWRAGLSSGTGERHASMSVAPIATPPRRRRPAARNPSGCGGRGR